MTCITDYEDAELGAEVLCGRNPYLDYINVQVAREWRLLGCVNFGEIMNLLNLFD